MAKTLVGAILAFLVFSAACWADDPKPVIRLPISREVPVAPAPIAVTELSEDSMFVIESEEKPCIVVASRTGFVTVTPETGPLRMRGRFADGSKIETRTYTAKYLWIVEAVKTGEVELIVVPDGAKEEKDIVRRTLAISGAGPRPPPVVPVDPPAPVDPPKPQPMPPIGMVGNRVLIVYESEDLNRYPTSQAATLTSAILRKYFADHCAVGPDGKTPEARIVDKDIEFTTDGQVWRDTIKLPRESLPWIYVSNGKTGYSGPMPKSSSEVMSLCAKYFEAKQ